MKLRPVHVDGLLVVCIACCGFSVSYLDSDDSFKYFKDATLRFWMIYCFGVVNAGCAALLFLRKNSYDEHFTNVNAAIKQADTVKTLQTPPVVPPSHPPVNEPKL